MGGYGGYVWPAYGITALVIVGLILAARRAKTEAERDWQAYRAESRTSEEAE